MVEQQSIRMIPHLLHLTYVRNEGAAFGLFPGRQPFFIVTSLLVLFVIAAYWRRQHPLQWPVVVALALVTAGAVGNLIDRSVLGYVTDFFEFGFFDFPVFNVADACIFVGVAVLMVWILFGPEETSDGEEAAEVSEAQSSDDGAGSPTSTGEVPEVVPAATNAHAVARRGRRRGGRMKPSDYFEHTIAPDEAGMRLDVLLGSLEFVASRSAAARLIDDGLVLVDGESAPKKHVVKAGERIEVEIPPYDRGDLVPEDIPLDIKFEDDHMIVLSKQAGLVVHPAQGNWTGTLVHALLAHSDELGTLQGDDRPGIVHRLDKDTSGLMMVAKSDEAQVALQEAIKIRSIDRRYLTLVHGRIAPDTGMIDAPLGRDQRERMKMAVSDSATAKQSVTTFRVLERFEAGAHDDGFTLLECKLYTGRTHQIRVHMAYIDHPCVGDPVYGQRRLKADLGLTRQFLHAYRLALKHPVTGEDLCFVDAPPEDLASRLAALAEYSAGRTAAGDEVFALLDSEPAP